MERYLYYFFNSWPFFPEKVREQFLGIFQRDNRWQIVDLITFTASVLCGIWLGNFWWGWVLVGVFLLHCVYSYMFYQQDWGNFDQPLTIVVGRFAWISAMTALARLLWLLLAQYILKI